MASRSHDLMQGYSVMQTLTGVASHAMTGNLGENSPELKCVAATVSRVACTGFVNRIPS